MVESMGMCGVTKVHGPYIRWNSSHENKNPAPGKGEGLVVKEVGSLEQYYYFKKTSWLKRLLVRNQFNKLSPQLDDSSFSRE